MGNTKQHAATRNANGKTQGAALSVEWATLAVEIPATVYARLEASAAKDGRGIEEAASFLLAGWVAETARRRAADGGETGARTKRGVSASAKVADTVRLGGRAA